MNRIGELQCAQRLNRVDALSADTTYKDHKPVYGGGKKFGRKQSLLKAAMNRILIMKISYIYLFDCAMYCD